ncbi:MAG: Restriction alleviation protein Lar [Tardiphaga sp.]|jgi:hypothetical protein|nr:Restriction alleviation protein Lar [Tardiphaga sp.]
MNDPINPCPFCGNDELKAPDEADAGGGWSVGCPCCDAMGPPGFTAKDGVERWNGVLTTPEGAARSIPG